VSLAERLKEIDRLIQPAHLFLNTAAQGRVLDAKVATIHTVIRDLTAARDMLNDLAEESDAN